MCYGGNYPAAKEDPLNIQVRASDALIFAKKLEHDINNPDITQGVTINHQMTNCSFDNVSCVHSNNIKKNKTEKGYMKVLIV